MAFHALFQQQMKVIMPSCTQRSGAMRRGGLSVDFFRGIRFRLVLFVLMLIAVTTFSISFIVIQIMDHVLIDSLTKRGSAISQAAAIPAGYSLLTNDRLALDNLAAQIKRSQEEIEYVAILDLEQNILAHNHLDRVGGTLPFMEGEMQQYPDGLVLTKGFHEGGECMEFRRPIYFTEQHVGNVVIGISTRQLMALKASAHKQILLIATLITTLALLGAMLLSSIFTRPIERLSEGVSKLRKDEHVGNIPVRSRNELGKLTHNFNKMARTIQQQKTSLHSYAAELETSYNDMVRILAAALDARDNYTYGHSARVARLALGLADKLALDTEAKKELELGCLLHDIGKIHVPDAVLNKQGKLDQDEYSMLTQHPLLGSEILELTPSLRKYIPAVKHHHERFDGNGYPDQLSGDEIPLHAQIIALADTYDAMTTSRPYREGLSREDTIHEIRRCSGSQFNPDLAELFIDVVLSTPENTTEKMRPAEYLCAS